MSCCCSDFKRVAIEINVLNSPQRRGTFNPQICVAWVDWSLKIPRWCPSPSFWASAPFVRRVFDARGCSVVQQLEDFAGIQLSLGLPQLLESLFLEI